MVWDAQSETLMETGNMSCFGKYRLSFLRNWNMHTLSQWMFGICFFHVLFLFVRIQLPKNLHVGILLPNKAGNCSQLWGWVTSFCWSYHCFLYLLDTKNPLQSFGDSKKLAPSFVFSPSSHVWHSKLLYFSLSKQSERRAPLEGPQ